MFSKSSKSTCTDNKQRFGFTFKSVANLKDLCYQYLYIIMNHGLQNKKSMGWCMYLDLPDKSLQYVLCILKICEDCL